MGFLLVSVAIICLCCGYLFGLYRGLGIARKTIDMVEKEMVALIERKDRLPLKE